MCESSDPEIDGVIQQRLDKYMSAKRAMPHFKIPIDSDEFRIVSGNENSHKKTTESIIYTLI